MDIEEGTQMLETVKLGLQGGDQSSSHSYRYEETVMKTKFVRIYCKYV